MKIIKLQVENIKKIKAARIQPNGNTVVISGKNKSGKTSLIDSIWYALGGAKDVPDHVVREGQDNGKIEVDLNGIKVTRIVRSDDTTVLKVWEDDVLVRSPQQLLNSLMGQVSLDPTEFMRARPEGQMNILIRAAGKADELADLKDKHERITLTRRDVGRDVKRQRAEIATIQLPDDCPTEEVNIDALRQKMDEQKAEEAKVAAIKNKCADLQFQMKNQIDKVRLLDERIKDLEHERETIEQSVREADGELGMMEAQLQSMPEPVGVSAIADEILQATEANTLYKVKLKRAAMERDLDKMMGIYQGHTDSLLSIANQKKALLDEVSSVVEGLSLGDDGAIHYQDRPFSLASSAEQLYVSTAIATHRNPEIKVLAVKDGSLLDEQSMAMLKKLALDQDYQVWVEVVDDSGDLGFYIEDGELAINKPSTNEVGR